MAKRSSLVGYPPKPNIPLLTHENPQYMREYYKAEEYLRTTVSPKDLKKEALKWIKNNGTYDHEKFVSFKDYRFQIIGKLCYLLNRGADIPVTGNMFLEKELSSLLQVQETKDDLEEDDSPGIDTSKKFTIQDHLREKAQNVAGEYFEAWVDELVSNPDSFDLKNCDPLSVLRKEDCKQGHARYIIGFYQPHIVEMNELLTTDDVELKEAYRLKKPHIKKLLSLYEKILSSADTLINSAKATRKPRAKKIKKVDTTKIVKGLKYQREDKVTGLVSINPVELIGASEIWFYNTKTRKLGMFVASDERGLSVKGTTILNFDEQKSLQKTLRRPNEQLKAFKGSSSRKYHKDFASINGLDLKVKGRTSEFLVLFKAFK